MPDDEAEPLANGAVESRKWYGIIGTGQSLGCGVQGYLERPTPNIPNALKLDDQREPLSSRYNLDKPEASSLGVVPLAEPIHAIHHEIEPELAYPWNIDGKTPHSSMAAQINAMVEWSEHAPFVTVHSCVARSGEPMTRINRSGGTNSYRASMYEARALSHLARTRNAHLTYEAIILTHGETDALLGNREYEELLLEFHADYSEDLRSITGQNHSPHLIVSQQHTCPPDTNTHPSPIAQAQWRAQHINEHVVCAGPKYQYGYHPDGLHFSAPSYDRLGEKYGQIFQQLIVREQPFSPLSPKNIFVEGDGKRIVLRFRVPVPPLRWENSLWDPHQEAHTQWSRGRGFEVLDAKGEPLEIKDVSIHDDDEGVVSIHLVRAPSCPLLHVAYAMTADEDGMKGGRRGGRVGHLCDSDPLVGASAEFIKIRAVHGETEILAVEEGAFQHRAVYDIVQDVAVAGEYAIANFDSHNRPRKVTLNRSWDGNTGVHSLAFRHNHRNFCVAFSAIVGPQGCEWTIPKPPKRAGDGCSTM